MSAPTYRIALSGRWTFTAQGNFMPEIEQARDADAPEIVINLREVTYIDSAALGMLLVARDRAQKKGKTLVLEACQPSVSNILKVASFDKLFTVR